MGALSVRDMLYLQYENVAVFGVRFRYRICFRFPPVNHFGDGGVERD